jgi:hypothetical protein
VKATNAADQNAEMLGVEALGTCYICGKNLLSSDKDPFLLLQIPQEDLVFIHKRCSIQEQKEIQILVDSSYRLWWYEPLRHSFRFIDKPSRKIFLELCPGN